MRTTPSVIVQRVKQAWSDTGVVLRPGVKEANIREFEQRYHVQMPADLVQYFLMVDGMNEGDTDEHDIRFWPLAEVRPAAEELDDGDPNVLRGYFVFSDYSVWAHSYAIRLSDSQRNEVVILGGDTPILVAPSFVEFLVLYTQQPQRLFKRA